MLEGPAGPECQPSSECRKEGGGPTEASDKPLRAESRWEKGEVAGSQGQTPGGGRGRARGDGW